ncbi:MAG: valine--tRNA ligase [Euryarchaeota archaeon TMED255]|nr:MAG: valine--tRNA ligase [Euryarchaeota archaeon TMED255]
MNKTFNPSDIETHWYEEWERQGYFNPSNQGRPYSIMIPPPNVTGSLHMGHGFQEALMDALIRYHRMDGFNTLWQVGTDHAGIATQMVVERLLESENLSREEIGREKFIEKVWNWKSISGGQITKQLRRLGSSLDWNRERFTMDEDMSAAVKNVFIQLYEDGLIYRGHKLVNWDPKLQTALSDLEVVTEEEDGSLWQISYPLVNGDGFLSISTTRPETLLGDTAVAVHPEDLRHSHLVGETLRVPIVNREIPIIADEYVDPDFGTGCVKITPAHDFNDYEIGKRHGLEIINILEKNGTLNKNVPKDFVALDRFDARKQTIKYLNSLGYLEKEQPHRLKIPRGDRSGVVLEPLLTMQWYVDAKKLSGPAITAVENGTINFVPKKWENTYFSWMRDIQDWCISRQLWWGHRIPAWYDMDGNIYVGESETKIREKNGLSDKAVLEQDEDVLDTWFSASLWTFSTLGWPKVTKELEIFHPTSVLVTGFDIIFFWVARMIMMTLYFMKEIPFQTVYVHGLVRDSDGQKMSKSKGNVIDPIDLIDGIGLDALVKKRTSGMMQPKFADKISLLTKQQYPDGIPAFGTDALRFTYYSLASTGRDIKFDIGRIQGYRNFCNKIWNAARYVLSNTQSLDLSRETSYNAKNTYDKWIISSLHSTIENVRNSLKNYRFDLASNYLYDFIWTDYCDWYLEFSKTILWDDSLDIEEKNLTNATLMTVLEAILRLLHPFMPFITEELWQNLSIQTNETKTIMLQEYPKSDDWKKHLEAEREIKWLQETISAIRTLRSEMNVNPGRQIAILIRESGAKEKTRMRLHQEQLKRLAKVESIDWIELESENPPSTSVMIDEMEILIPLEGIIDKAKELSRLSKEIKGLRNEISILEKKLDNTDFVQKAPSNIVENQRNKLIDYKNKLNALILQEEKIANT